MKLFCIDPVFEFLITLLFVLIGFRLSRTMQIHDHEKWQKQAVDFHTESFTKINDSGEFIHLKVSEMEPDWLPWPNATGYAGYLTSSGRPYCPPNPLRQPW